MSNLEAAPAELACRGGGPAAEEDIIMWWNFVGRSHEEIVAFRQAWEAELDQFGRVEGYEGTPQRLPARHCPMPGSSREPGDDAGTANAGLTTLRQQCSRDTRPLLADAGIRGRVHEFALACFSRAENG